jgi:hypothetical protein
MTWTHKDGTETPVEVQICAPLPRYFVEADDNDWYCAFQVVGLGDDTVRAAFGVDSIQALYSALMIIGALIEATPPGKSGELDWRIMPNLGFPAVV